MGGGRARVLAALAIAIAACGDDEGAGSGGSGSSTGSGGGDGGGGSVTTAGTGGSPACTADPTSCSCCEEIDGVCVPACVMGIPEGFSCASPGPPPADRFSCAGVLHCGVDEACVVVASESVCPEHFCEPLPPPCVADPSCACLQEFLDTELTRKTCEDTPGGARVDLAALGVVWDPPFCGGVVCEEPEICWSCVDAAGMSFACSEEDPASGEICTPAR